MAVSYRRRRILWSALLLIALVLFYASSLTPFSFDLSASSSSHVGQVALAKLRDSLALGRGSGGTAEADVPEVYGLLHFVTQYSSRRLNEAEGKTIDVRGRGRVKVDPERRVDLAVFDPDGKVDNSGKRVEVDWDARLRMLREEYPLVIFSKTFCPYSKRAKSLFASYDLDPVPYVVELNTRSDGPIIQSILARLTGRKTVPNILLQGKSIGGSDDVNALHSEHKLKAILEEAGLEVNGEAAGILQVHAA